MKDQSDQGSGGGGWIVVTPRLFVGLVGAVACFGWLFLALGTSAFVPFFDLSNFAIGFVHLSFVAGISLVLFASWALSNVLSSHKVLHFSLSLALSFAGLFGLWLVGARQSPFVCIPSALMGAGFGLLYTLYSEFICAFFYGSVKQYVYGIFGCAAFACAGLLFTSENTSFFFAIVFPIVAFAAYAFVLLFYRLQDFPVVDKKESDARHRVAWRSYLATATSGLAAGFALGCMLSMHTSQSMPYVIVETLVVVVCLVLFTDALKFNRINETVTMRFFLSFSAVVVFPLIFVPDEFKFILASLLLCGSIIPTTCSISAMYKHTIICDLSAIRSVSLGRLMSFMGVFLGMAMSFVGFSLARHGILPPIMSSASVIAFMLLVIFSASFVMTEDNYPDESRFHIKGGEDGPERVSVDPGTPIYKVVGSGSSDDEDGVEESIERHPRGLRIKCDVIARACSLSGRQREVLEMLAKGRNADFIASELVISLHTAKAHIYNIYQKTGVHSRQELISLVENVELDEDGLTGALILPDGSGK